MKNIILKAGKHFCLAGIWRACPLVLLILLLANISFGEPVTNTIRWSDNFQTYSNLTPLINGTNGWYSYPSIPQTSIVQNTVYNSGSQAAMVGVGDTLENRFNERLIRNVRLEMYIQPAFATNIPKLSSGIAAQFYVNSNGHFVVGNGGSWNDATKMVGGADAIPITNTCFTKVEIHLRYKSHTWDLKAWSNSTLVAYTNSLSFASNVNYFTGFALYNGESASYVDDVTVRRWPSTKINGISIDNIKFVNDALPDGNINGLTQ